MSRTTTDQLIAVVSELTKLDRRGKEYVHGWLTKELEKMRAKKARNAQEGTGHVEDHKS